MAAQVGVGAPGKYAGVFSAANCFKQSNYLPGFKPDSLKANYIMKGVRIWRSVSLENKQNELVLNDGVHCSNIGLFEIIKFGIFEKQLNVFSSDDFNEANTTRLSRDLILKMITSGDSSAVPAFDANGEPTKEISSSKKYLMGGDIKCFLVKEDWITNSNSGKTEKYIIGLAPLVYDVKTEKTTALFWLYYPEWKALFAAFTAKNLYAYEPVSFEGVFRKRYFVSQISKESNVFDRRVKSFNHGNDMQLESELIKEKLNNAESDLFQY